MLDYNPGSLIEENKEVDMHAGNLSSRNPRVSLKMPPTSSAQFERDISTEQKREFTALNYPGKTQTEVATSPLLRDRIKSLRVSPLHDNSTLRSSAPSHNKYVQ